MMEDAEEEKWEGKKPHNAKLVPVWRAFPRVVKWESNPTFVLLTDPLSESTR